MRFRLATWNINSVRLRLPLVVRFLKDYKPDILCLQEIKCTEEQVPVQDFHELGYEYCAINGQKGYHGVATLSRLPLEIDDRMVFGGISEARHIAVRLPGCVIHDTPLVLHNFYVPAGGDIPDADQNPKFRQKLDFLTDMATHFATAEGNDIRPMILVGDLNVAPLENDVWSHKQMLKVVSHTPIEVEHLDRAQQSIDWVDAMRLHVPADQKLYTWWSYRAKDWRASNRGRRLDHIWLTPGLRGVSRNLEVIVAARDWDRPSDHVPVVCDIDLGV